MPPLGPQNPRPEIENYQDEIAAIITLQGVGHTALETIPVIKREGDEQMGYSDSVPAIYESQELNPSQKMQAWVRRQVNGDAYLMTCVVQPDDSGVCTEVGEPQERAIDYQGALRTFADISGLNPVQLKEHYQSILDTLNLVRMASLIHRADLSICNNQF